MTMNRTSGGTEMPPSPEQLNHKIGELLLSCKRVGEGGKAVVLKLSVNEIPEEFDLALEALGALSDENVSRELAEAKAIKLLKLYLPNRGAMEYKMHRLAYDATREIPEDRRHAFAKIPALSSARDINLEADMKQRLESKFGVVIAGDKTQLIVMEYVDGEDLATIFYKWILENERRFTPEQTDVMDFKLLYEEVSKALRFESLPEEEVHDPRALEIAEWKNNSNNTKKLYDYLQRHKFPLSPEIVMQVQNTIELLHRSHIIHGDVFERNIMMEGGTQALRSNMARREKQTYLIDFGEARDHDVEGVDDFSVIRRLKQLLVSSEELAAQKIKKEFAALDAKAASLRERNKRWQELYAKVKKLAESNQGGALTLAWNYTAALGEGFIEDFFVIVKELMGEHPLEKGIVDAFIEEKRSSASSPFQKRRLRECAQWLEG